MCTTQKVICQWLEGIGESYPQLQAEAQEAIVQLVQLQERQELINDIVQAMRGTLALEELLQNTTNRLHSALLISRCLMVRPDSDNQMVVRHVSKANSDDESLLGVNCEFYRYYHEQLTQGTAVALSRIDASLPPQLQVCATEYGIRSLLIVPLLHKETYIGGISLHQSDREREWTADDIAFVKTIADHFAIAIVQATLFERKQAELQERQRFVEALQDSERRFRAIFNGTFQFTGLLTPEGNILEVNQAVLDFLGLELKEVVGNPCWQGRWWKNTTQTQQLLQAAIAQATRGEFVRYELEVIGRDGTTANIDFSLLPQKDEAGNVVLLIAEGRDITELKETQSELRRANEELETRVQTRTKALRETNHHLLLEILERHTAQEQLRQSQEMLQMIIENIPQCVFWKNTNSVYLGCNSHFANMAGLEHPTDVIGKTDYDLGYSHQDADLYRKHDTRIIQKNKPEYYIMAPHRRGNDYPVWLETKKVPLHDTKGKVIGVLGTVEDITERYEAQSALLKSEQRFRFLAESIPQQVWIAQANGSLEYVNQRVLQYAGVTNGQVMGWAWTDCIHPEDLSHCLESWQKSLTTGEPYEIEFRLFQAMDNSYRWHLSRALPLRDESGNIVNWFGTNTDIHDYKQAEQAVRHSEERFRNLVETSSDWVWEVNEHQVYTYASSKVCDILGYLPQEVVGKTPFEFMPPPEAERIADIWAAHSATKKPFTCLENTNIHKNGQLVVIETNGTPFFDTEGNFRGYRGIDRDITERKRAEEELQQAKDQLRAVLDAVPGLVSWISSDLRYLGVNHHLATSFKQPPEVFVGREIGFLESSADFAELIRCFFTSSAHQISSEISAEVNGEPRSYLLVAQKYQQGEAAVSVGIDITERKRMEEQLRATSSRLTALIQNLQAGILVGNESRQIVLVNQEFCDMFAISIPPEVLLGRTSISVFDEISQLLFFESEDFVSRVNEIIHNRQVVTDEELQLADGRTLERDYVPIYVDGTYYGQLWMYRDITGRKQAEMALRMSQEQLQYLVSSSPAVIYSFKVDDNHTVTFMSDNITAMTGYESQEFFNNPGFWKNHVHPEDLPDILANLPKLFEHGEYNHEYRFLYKDGAYHWVYDRAKLVRDETGNGLKVVGYWADISDRKRLEAELRQALAKEKELNELKSRFISMTSHEFRTPLSTILSSAELLEHYRHKWSDDKQLTHLHRIQTAVKHMTQMLNDVLIIGKAEAGKLNFNPAPLDLITYCQNIVEQVQLNARNQHTISFGSEFSSLPACMDEKLLGHILNNLLSNAIKYSPTGSTVTLTLTCEDNQSVFLAIQDMGIGIPSEDLPLLFESFHRATNVGNIQGTGLGLAIVKKCIDAHQGEITVISEIGVGTTFTVKLPLQNKIEERR
jgi:PAS domain S-box-containing protein